MSYQNQVLIRTSLTDEGVLGQRGFSYKSPDMISHSQVADPVSYFTANYGEDPNEPLDQNSATNFVYVRAKAKEANVKGYVWLYCCGSSLFMKPSQWKQKKVYTVSGSSCAMLSPAANNGDVIVVDDPFLLNGLNTDYFCMVAITTEDKTEVLPGDFSTYDQFNYWVRTNTGVAVRNFSVLKNGIVYDFQRLDSLSNPESEPITALIEVSWKGMPAGYTVGIRCDAIPGMENSEITDGSDGSVFAAEKLPAGFDGYVETYAYNTDGESIFPENAQITTKFYTTVTLEQMCFQFGKTVEELGINAVRKIGFTETNKLILTGECSTIFK